MQSVSPVALAYSAHRPASRLPWQPGRLQARRA